MPSSSGGAGVRAMFVLSDDADYVFYELEFHPLNKAEVAHLLLSRTNALKQGAFTN